ncbi:MAG: ABC transporter permease [bacterium]|nr:ABC transporter permease [bacterium]
MFSNITAIYRKELRSYFSSPVAYIVIAMFLFLAGFFFYSAVVQFRMATLDAPFSNLVIILIFLMPLLSMRLISEEKKSGTLELLLTRPIREMEIVLGKYFAAATVFFIMLLPTATYGLILNQIAKPDLYPMLTQYAAVFLVGLAFLAVGLFASALSENQIVSAVIAFTIILILWLLSWLTSSLGEDNIISYFAISSHFNDLITGVIDARDVVFYITFIFFWLFVTAKIIDSKRWA